MTPDVNVLVAASRTDHPHHEVALAWLQTALADAADGGPCVILPMVAAGFLRLVTHPRVFVEPTPAADAVAFLRSVLAAPGVDIAPLGGELEALAELCETRALAGNAVPDAWIAVAVAARGEVLATFDRGMRRWLPRRQVDLLEG